MSQHFGDLEGVETGIVVHSGTEMKHDCRQKKVLNRCKKINLKLNEKKRVFKVKEVTNLHKRRPSPMMKSSCH